MFCTKQIMMHISSVEYWHWVRLERVPWCWVGRRVYKTLGTLLLSATKSAGMDQDWQY